MTTSPAFSADFFYAMKHSKTIEKNGLFIGDLRQAIEWSSQLFYCHHLFFFLASLNCISLSTSLWNGLIKPFRKIFLISAHTLMSGSFRSPSMGILVAKESLCLFFNTNPKKVTTPSHTLLNIELLGFPRLSIICILYTHIYAFYKTETYVCISLLLYLCWR